MNITDLFAPNDFKNHWNESISTADYHADKTAVNSSSLKRMVKSPRAFHASFFLGKNDEVSDSMKFGTLAHMALLEGEKFREKYVVMPEFMEPTLDGKLSANSKAAKEKKAQWLADQPSDSIICSKDEQERIFGMIDSLLSHEKAFALLKDGKPELTGYWKDPETGLRCRMKADFISFNLGALVDVKTTTDCVWEEFRRSVEKLRYDIQMAQYDDGIFHITGKRPEHRVWLAIESKFPYEVACHEVPPQYQATGRYEYKKALKNIKDCILANSWPQAQADIEFGEMSPWFYKKYEFTGVLDDASF